MSRRTQFVPYQPKTILNKSQRADHWFWTRYSAYPYLGCQHGCEFCYCRERKFYPYDDPADFAFVVKAKTNAPALLHRALSRAPVDAVFTGDYQPAEKKFLLSRQMLQVCAELGFPVFILSRSPLVLRDLDVLQTINARARATVAFSIISTPDSPHHAVARQLERLAPGVEKRFAAMEQFARAGIPTGACMMPILPGVCDDDANLANVARWTAAHGGKFVLASGLTLADQQREFFFGKLRAQFPHLVPLYEQLYPVGSYAAAGVSSREMLRRVRGACERVNLADRMPRPIIAGEKRARNKRIVETLANQIYTFELEDAPKARVWAYRQAAWAIEDLEQDVGLVYRALGLKGLEAIPNVTRPLAREIEKLIGTT